MALYKITDEVLDAMWMNIATVYSVMGPWRPLAEALVSPRQCSIRDGAKRCERMGAYERNGKQLCEHHAPRLQAQYTRDYDNAVAHYAGCRAKCTSVAGEREALEDSKHRAAKRGTVRTPRPF